MSQHVITAEVAAEKFKKSDIHTNRSENNGVGSTTTAAAPADDDTDANVLKTSGVATLKNELAASVGGDEARDDSNAGTSTAADSATATAGERAPKVSMGAIKSFADFEDDSVDDNAGAANLDDIDADDDAAALLDPEVDRAHFGRRSSGGVSRDYDNDDSAAAAADLADSGATIEPYTPPGTPPPLSPSDEDNGTFVDTDSGVAPSSRRFVNAQTALFGVNLDMDTARADGTLNCRGKLPLAVVRSLTPKMSVVGRMELEKCDSYLAALSSSSSRDRALCYISASGADSSEKLAQIAQSLRERARVGVIKLAKSNPNLRECFLIPWNGTEPLPSFLTQFTTLLPQPADDAPLLVVLVLSKQAGAAGIAAGLLTTSSDGAATAPPPVVARVSTPAVTVPPPTPVLFGGTTPPNQLSLALSSLAASLAAGGGAAALLAATRGAAQPPPQQPAMVMQQAQQPQQVLPHQLHQQQLQQQQQMRQQHILMQQQQQQQQHHRFGPPQHHQQPPMMRPGMPIDPRTGLPLGQQPPPPRGW